MVTYKAGRSCSWNIPCTLWLHSHNHQLSMITTQLSSSIKSLHFYFLWEDFFHTACDSPFVRMSDIGQLSARSSFHFVQDKGCTKSLDISFSEKIFSRHIPNKYVPQKHSSKWCFFGKLIMDQGQLTDEERIKYSNCSTTQPAVWKLQLIFVRFRLSCKHIMKARGVMSCSPDCFFHPYY